MALLKRSARSAEAAALARVEREPVSGMQAAIGPPPPVWLNNVGDPKINDGRCVVYAGHNRCQASSSSWVWIGCTVGEHLDRSAACTRHAEDIARRGDTYTCKRCWDALGRAVTARVIKIEEINDDDEGPAAPPGTSPDLLP
jgi:hypothetical protein